MEKNSYETPSIEVIDLPEAIKLLVGTPDRLFGDPADPADMG